MSVESVGRYSLRYSALLMYGWIMHRLWYRRITVNGRENIPKDPPVILTPNHRNALMDALAVLFTQSNQTAFLARADIFRNPIAARLLTFIKIMPIYRPRDGRREMSTQNDESFRAAVQVMKMGRPLVMFPEGDHGEPKRLRPLKKGVVRIAFQAEEQHDFRLNLKIVPVGIDYEHFRFRSALTVTYGKPIDVDSYGELYRTDPHQAIRKLQDEIREGIKSLMIHVEDEAHYSRIINLLDLYPSRLRLKQSATRIKDDQRIIEMLKNEREQNSASWQELVHLLDGIKEKAHAIRIQATTIPALLNRHILPLYHFLLALAGLPLGIYGAVNNLPAFFLVMRFRRMFKDPQFDATSKFTFGVLALPFIYVFQALIFQLLVRDWGLTAIYLISLPIGLLFAFHYVSFLAKQVSLSLRMIFSTGFYARLKEINQDKKALFSILRGMEKGS